MPSTRDRMLALVHAEPHLNQAEIAARLKVTRQRIKQLADEEGLTLKRGPVGVSGRKPKAEDPVKRVTGGLIEMPPGASPAVAVLLTAADLTARGYAVFLPVNQTASCDLVTIDPATDKVERVVVRKARRAGAGEEVRYDDPIRGRADRRAFLLTDEPGVRYEPAIKPRS